MTNVATDGPPPTDYRAEERLERLGVRTVKARGNADKGVVRAYGQLENSERVLVAHKTELDDRNSAESAARAELDGERGISTPLYAAILLFLAIVNYPVARQVFEVFLESRGLTIQLAIVTDAVFLLVAHVAGLTLRRVHDPEPGSVVLDWLERAAGWSLFVLGAIASLWSGWVRYDYFQTTGAGAGVPAIAFTTLIAIVTFLLVTLLAYRHHLRGGNRVDWLAFRRWRAERKVRKAEHRLAEALEIRNRELTRRKIAAGRWLTLAGQVKRQALHAAATPVRIDDPDWLKEERRIEVLLRAGFPCTLVDYQEGITLREIPSET
jgi:hypothetical protein